MSTQPAQSRTIRAQLLSDMREGRYAACERLPRESVLAEKLGISRTQLRDVLASLEREGFITRRHGVGTIINRHVLNAHTRMDIEVEFLDMIRQSGHQAAVAFVRRRMLWRTLTCPASFKFRRAHRWFRSPGFARRTAGPQSTVWMSSSAHGFKKPLRPRTCSVRFFSFCRSFAELPRTWT